MNSERRHELQHNWLADQLARINVSIEPYSKPIAVIVAGLIVAGVGVTLYQSSASGQRSDATLQLILAAGENDSEVLGMVSENYAETKAASWARLYQGDQLMARGIRVLYTDEAEAKDSLLAAQTAFEQALASAENNVLKSRAHFGLARVAETQGKIDEAITHYKETIAANESKEMVQVAQQRIDALSRPSTKDFLAWFDEQDFRPVDPAMPPALPGSSALPDLPDLKLPDLELPDDPAAASTEMKPNGQPIGADALNASTAPKEGGLEMPADKPTNDKPAEPAETKAAEETKPADAKPAEEAKPAAATESVKEVELAPADGTPATTEAAPATTEAAPAETTDAPSSDSAAGDAENGESS